MSHVRLASFNIISLSYGKEDGILGGPLRAINLLSAEDNCLQVAGSIFLELSIKYDDGAPLKLGPGAKCPPCPPLLAPLHHS